MHSFVVATEMDYLWFHIKIICDATMMHFLKASDYYA